MNRNERRRIAKSTRRPEKPPETLAAFVANGWRIEMRAKCCTAWADLVGGRFVAVTHSRDCQAPDDADALRIAAQALSDLSGGPVVLRNLPGQQPATGELISMN